MKMLRLCDIADAQCIFGKEVSGFKGKDVRYAEIGLFLLR